MRENYATNKNLLWFHFVFVPFFFNFIKLLQAALLLLFILKVMERVILIHHVYCIFLMMLGIDHSIASMS